MESGKKLFSKLWPLGSKESNQAELTAFGQGEHELPTEASGSKRARLFSAVKSTVGWPISLIYNTTQKTAPDNHSSSTKYRGEETIVDVDATESKRLEQVTKEFLEKIKEYYSKDLLAALDKFIHEFNRLPNLEGAVISVVNSMLDQSSDSDENLSQSKLDPHPVDQTNNNHMNNSHNSHMNISPEELQKERGNKVKDFVSMMIGRFLLNSYWRAELTNQKSLDDLRECIERYIMAKIFKKAYIPNKTEDWKLAQLISSLQFIQPSHLDIKSLVHPELIEDCSDILTQINFYVIPKNKLNCISGCCLTIFKYLEALQSQSANKAAVSVDDFLPILVYIIIKTNPPSLISNMNYIEDYTPTEDLETSMTGYFFANLKIVVSFIKQLANNPSKLSLTESDNGEMSEEWLREQKALLLKAIQPPEIKKEDDRGAWLFRWVPLLPFIKKRDANINNSANNIMTDEKAHLAASQFRETMTSEMKNEQDLQNSEISAPVNEDDQKRLKRQNSVKSGLSTNDTDFLQEYSFWNCLAEDVKPRDIPELLAEYKRLAWYEYTQKQKKKLKKNKSDQD